MLSQVDPTTKASTLVDILRWRACHQTDELAYTFLRDGEVEQASLTFGELDRRARAIAAQLQSRNAAGERALLLYPPGLAFIAAFLGCLYAGVVAVPVYPPDPARLPQTLPKLRAIIGNARPSIALTVTPILAMVNRMFARDADFQTMLWLATDEGSGNPSANPGQALASDWREPALDGDTLAFLQYTSGSTGTPRGVMVSHGTLLHNERMIKTAFDHTRETVFAGWLPLFHDMGLVGNVFQPLYLGIPCILMSPLAFLQEPFRWLQAISRYRATTSGAPNFAYDLCVRKTTQEQQTTLDLSSWEVAFNGAEPVRAETLERFATAFEPCGFRREAFYPCYGLAEATLFVSGGLKTASPVLRPVEGAALEQDRIIPLGSEEEGSRTIVGCGQAWLDERIVIVDPQSLNLCRPGRIGEVWVSGSNVAQGYWNRPDETERTFKARLVRTGEGPFLRTGDLGAMWDGELFITGRLKDLIIIRGRNHYPQDIELTVERSHPALRAGCGAAFSVDVGNKERLVVVQEVKRDHVVELKVEHVIGAIRQAVWEEHGLRVYAVSLLETRSVPKTSSGKIRRHACRDGFLAGSLDVVGSWRERLADYAPLAQTEPFTAAAILEDLAQSTPAEQKKTLTLYLRTLIAQVLRVEVEKVSAQSSILRLGLDSLMAMEVLNQISQDLQITMYPQAFFERPSISTLAEFLVAAYVPTRLQYELPGQGQVRGAGFARTISEGRLETRSTSPDNELPLSPIHRRISPLRRLAEKAVAAAWCPIAARLLAWYSGQRWIQERFYREQVGLVQQFYALLEGVTDREEDVVRQSILFHLKRRWWCKLLLHGTTRLFNRWVIVTGLPAFRQSYQKGNGIILLVDHNGLLPLLKQVSSRRGFDSVYPIGRQHMKMRKMSHRAGKGGRMILYGLLLSRAQQVLERGGTVGIAADGRAGGRQGIVIRFHGRMCEFKPGFAELALTTGADAIPVFVSIDRSGRIKADFLDPLDAGPETMDHDVRIERLVRQYAELLRQRWVRYPGSILWSRMRKHLALPPVLD